MGVGVSTVTLFMCRTFFFFCPLCRRYGLEGQILLYGRYLVVWVLSLLLFFSVAIDPNVVLLAGDCRIFFHGNVLDTLALEDENWVQ